MVKKISRIKARTRRARLRGFLRWLCYSLVLLLFYLWEVAPLIRGWCPLLIIPLATAVAMFEGEFAAGVFGVFCGFMLDIASGTLIISLKSMKNLQKRANCFGVMPRSIYWMLQWMRRES